MPDNIDHSTFVFRDTTVDKFIKNMEAKNKPGKKRKNTFEGPFGTCRLKFSFYPHIRKVF